MLHFVKDIDISYSVELQYFLNGFVNVIVNFIIFYNFANFKCDLHFLIADIEYVVFLQLQFSSLQ